MTSTNRLRTLALLALVAPAVAHAEGSRNAVAPGTAAIPAERIARVDVSSTSTATEAGRRLYRATNLADGHDWSPWGSDARDARGAWVNLAFRQVEYVSHLDFVPGDARATDSFSGCGRPASLRLEAGGETRTIPLSDERWAQSVDVSPPLYGRALRVVVERVHGNSTNAGVCMSELRLSGPTDPRASVEGLAARIEESVAQLADDLRAARGKAALVRIGPPAVEALLAATASNNASQVGRALEALGEIGDARALSVATTLSKSRDADIADAALGALGALGSADHFDTLRAWYDRTQGARKARAFRAIAQLGDERGLDLVIAELLGADAERRLIAEQNLGRFGKAAVDAVSPLLGSPVASERAAGLRALGSVPHPDARALLTASLSSGGDPELRAAAIRGLALLGDASMRPAIASMWDSRYLSDRQAVAFALGRFAAGEDLETLSLMTEDTSMSVRQAAAEALAAYGVTAQAYLRKLALLGPDGGTAGAAARGLVGPDAEVEALLPLLGSRHREVRKMVVSALAERGEVGRAALVTALQQDEADVRQAAAEVLKRSGRDLVPVVASQLVAAKAAAQADMLRLLAHHRDERAVEPAAALLRSSPDMVVRRLAVETLAACEAPAVWGPAVADALDKDIAVEVQQAAATALGRARWTDAVPALIAQLDTPHRELRRLTVLALGQMRDARALPALSNLYQAKALKTDDDPSLRENIVESIARIGGEGSVPVLMAAATDRDVRVRYTARDALR